MKHMRQPIDPAERTECAELYRRAAEDAAGRGAFQIAELYLDLYQSALADVDRDPVELEIDIMFDDAELQSTDAAPFTKA